MGQEKRYIYKPIFGMLVKPGPCGGSESWKFRKVGMHCGTYDVVTYPAQITEPTIEVLENIFGPSLRDSKIFQVQQYQRRQYQWHVPDVVMRKKGGWGGVI